MVGRIIKPMQCTLRAPVKIGIRPIAVEVKSITKPFSPLKKPTAMRRKASVAVLVALRLKRLKKLATRSYDFEIIAQEMDIDANVAEASSRNSVKLGSPMHSFTAIAAPTLANPSEYRACMERKAWDIVVDATVTRNASGENITRGADRPASCEADPMPGSMSAQAARTTPKSAKGSKRVTPGLFLGCFGVVGFRLLFAIRLVTMLLTAKKPQKHGRKGSGTTLELNNKRPSAPAKRNVAAAGKSEERFSENSM